MNGWMDGWGEGRTSQIKFLTIPLIPFSLALCVSCILPSVPTFPMLCRSSG